MSIRQTIKKLRNASKSIVFRLFRYAFFIGVAVFLISMFLTGDCRLWAMRIFSLCLGGAVSGLFVYYGLIAIDEWINGRYGASVWMIVWVILLGFMIYTGFRIAIYGMNKTAQEQVNP